LRLFIVHRGKVLTHRQILSELWGPKAKGQTHYLRVYMMRLRQKLENDPDTPQYLQTESGIGYRLSA
jgi:two-component system KDP operon response regulator KdpE